MKSCLEFRTRLRAAIEGHLSGAPLAWHEHLVGCAACRELFEAEEALDALLACLPEPQLPVALAQRVLRRLERDRQLEHALDQVLDEAVGAAEAPADLSARILAGLGSAGSVDELLELVPAPEAPSGLAARVTEAAALEALLDLDPVPKVPASLTGHVLRGLAAELEPAERPEAPILRPAFGRARRLAAVAAVVLAVAALWRLWPGDAGSVPSNEPLRIAKAEPDREVDTGAESTPEPDPVGVGSSESTPEVLAPSDLPDPELLAALDVLEDWELLVPSDLDLVLGSLDETETELLLLDLDTAEEDSEG